jgi:hypothetical protein
MAINFQIQSRTRTSMRLAALLLTTAVPAAMVPAAMVAQQAPAPKVEIFGGYSAYFPGATASGLLPLGVTPIASCLCWNHRGAGVGATYDFNRWLGLTVDVSDHWGDGATTASRPLLRVQHLRRPQVHPAPRSLRPLRRGAGRRRQPHAGALCPRQPLRPACRWRT